MSENTEAGGLVERLRDRAESYRMGGPSSEHTAAILDEAATTLEAQAEELSSLRMMADSQVVSHRDFNTVRAEKSEAALASERAAHAAKDAEIARLTAEKDAAEFAARNSKSLDGDALHAVRALLDSAGVPKAAFIDDHVGNAIAQRDAERAAHAETKRERDELKADIDSYAEASSNLATELSETETRLAEAMKALDGLLEPFEGDDCRYDHHGYCQAHFLQEGDECCVKIARRVREGGEANG